MKLASTVHVLLLVLLSLSLKAQKEYAFSVNNLSFTELLQSLKSKYQLSFAYDSELIVEDKFSFDIQADNIEDLLYKIWEEAYLDCKFINDRQVLLRSKRVFGDQSFLDFEIVDDATGEPLEMVAVSMNDGQTGTFSDIDGHARLFPADASTKTINLYLLGYENVSINLSPSNESHRIAMRRSNIPLDEIIVKDRITPVTYDIIEGKTTIRNQYSIGMASSLVGNDVMRQVQLLPGVAAHDDASAQLKIRGGDENQTLIVMDGIPIYNASHYYGIFSSINSSFVSEMSLFKNNLPIQYGGKTSGMLDMSSNSAIGQNKVTGIADINLLTTSLTLHIPIEKTLSLSLGGRTSYNNVSESGLSSLISPDATVGQGVQNFSLISRQNIINSIPSFRFNDWNAKLLFTPNAKHSIDLNFYHSNDLLSDGYLNSFDARRQNVLVKIEEQYNNQEDWSNIGFSLKSAAVIDSSLSLFTTGYFTRYDNDALVDLSLLTQVRNNTNTILTFNEQINHISDVGIKSYLNYQKGSNTLYTGGLEYVRHSSDLSVKGTNLDNLKLNKEEQELSSFISVQNELSEGLVINGGLRASYYTGTDGFFLAPRINISKSIDDQWSLKAAAGRHYQFVRELTFENVFGRSRDVWTLADGNKIPVNKADNIMIGARWKNGRWSLDIEAYHKWMEGVIEYAFETAPFTEEGDPAPQRKFDFFDGTGESKGVDIMFSYTSPLYSTWMSYTLGESTNSFPRIQRGTDFPAQDDRRHQWKWVNELRYKDFNFSANIIYASGRPYTDISLLMANNSREQLRPQDRISRLPDYIRMDLGVNYALPIKGVDATVGLSAFNILDRINVNYIQYIFSVPANMQNQQKNINTVIGTSTDLLPRTINLNFSLRF